MKTLKPTNIIRLFLLATLLCITYNGTPSVNATSAWDSTYRTADSFTLFSYYLSCDPMDVTDWKSIATNPNSYFGVSNLQAQQYATDAQSAISETLNSPNGAVAITRFESWWGDGIRIMLSPDGGDITWDDVGYTGVERQVSAKSDDVYIITFSYSKYSSRTCDQPIEPPFTYTNLWRDLSIPTGGSIPNTISNEINGAGGYYAIATWGWDVYYPASYEGEALRSGSALDDDSDGLNLIQELHQGTSDAKKDTDGDGIDDFKESIWFPDRDEVFCNTTATPYTCAYPDPAIQDLYLEIDWMYDPVTNKTFKPTSTQLALVETMFANEGINFHVDIGDYGGGAQLADYAEYLRQDSVNGIPDFLNYKYGGDGITRNFAAKRQDIWRYMISGHGYSTGDGISLSSGWAVALGDNLFLAKGVIENIQSSIISLDRAVAGTIAHEMGHSLCLTDTRYYFEQSEMCIYAGIDNSSGEDDANNADAYYDLENYKSVMNYYYQLTRTDKSDLGIINYSHGVNSSDDHNDWSAVKASIGGFSGTHTLYVEFGAKGKVKTLEGRAIIENPSTYMTATEGQYIPDNTLTLTPSIASHTNGISSISLPLESDGNEDYSSPDSFATITTAHSSQSFYWMIVIVIVIFLFILVGVGLLKSDLFKHNNK